MSRPEPHKPRQWRLTLAESGDASRYSAALSWRTFPCRADGWDGHRYASIFALGPRISSPEDLEAVLALFVGVNWHLRPQDSPYQEPVLRLPE